MNLDFKDITIIAFANAKIVIKQFVFNENLLWFDQEEVFEWTGKKMYKPFHFR